MQTLPVPIRGGSATNERGSIMNAQLATLAAATIVLAALPGGPAQAKSVGGCPEAAGFTLVTVASLEIPPEDSDGLASLDGNDDGWTCIKPVAGGKWTIFRDNTVGGS